MMRTTIDTEREDLCVITVDKIYPGHAIVGRSEWNREAQVHAVC
jgi:hypothetical protein